MIKLLKLFWIIPVVNVSWFDDYKEEHQKLESLKHELHKLISTPTANKERLDVLYEVRNIVYKY